MEGGSLSMTLAEGGERPARAYSALLIMNPAARGARRALPAVREAFRQLGVECDVEETRAPAHATELVRARLSSDQAPLDAVFSLGGDGTAMEIATALAESPDSPPLGIIALGTANVLARSLGIPLRPADAVRALHAAETVAIDLGRIAEGPRFAIGLGVGLDAAMIGGASSLLKRRVGYIAYAWSAVRAGLRMERFTARLTIDGVTTEVETSSVLVANFGLVLGDLVCFGEEIGHRDGLLHVCVYSPRSILDAVRIFWRMVRGGVSEDRCVRVMPGRHIRVETDPPRPMQADGELLGLTPVDIRVEPNAVRLLAPVPPPRRWRLRRAAPTLGGSQLRSSS